MNVIQFYNKFISFTYINFMKALKLFLLILYFYFSPCIKAFRLLLLFVEYKIIRRTKYMSKIHNPYCYTTHQMCILFSNVPTICDFTRSINVPS